MPKAYVLLSGGIDSSTCLALACQEFEGLVCGIGVSYGQRHTNEIQHAQMVAKHFSAAFIQKDLRGLIGIGGLTDNTLVVPKVSYANLPEGVSPTFVPYRNGLLLSLAASVASADLEAVSVYYGAHAEDAERDAYPDCSVPFIEAQAEAIRIGTYDKIKLTTPLKHMTKAEVIHTGDGLGVPWELTWSCYEGHEFHCGICPTCRSRREGFRLAGATDPTVYEQEPVEMHA